MAASFVYQSLPGSRYIRLVHLSLDSAVAHGFKIKLTEASLDNDVEFRALSYTWGLPFHADILDLEKPTIDCGEAFSLLVDGQSFTVTENLFYALKQLGENGEQGPFWIDALSINQQNDTEKLAQVSMMSDIYSSASQVVVWLGKDDPPPKLIAMHQNEALEAFMTKVAHGDSEPIPTEEDLKPMGMDTLIDWQEMWWIYVSWYRQQKYFRRVWIIQETALARDIVVRCGTCALDWTRLVVIGNLLLSSMINSQWTLLGPRSDLLAKAGGWTPGNEIRQLHMFRTDHHLNGGLPMHLHKTKANFLRGRQDGMLVDTVTESLLRGLGDLGDPQHKEYAYFSMVMRQFADYHATEEKDHVFAALSFCAPFFRKAGMAVPPISVSYEQTVEEVFTEVAAKLLASLPALTTLSFVNMATKRNTRLPSWVPDFAARHTCNNLVMRVTGGPVDKDEAGHPIYNATSLVWPLPEEQDGPLATFAGQNQLLVMGTRLDSVKAVLPPSVHSESPRGIFPYLPYLEFAVENLPLLYPPTCQLSGEVLWRTMCGNYHGSYSQYPASPFIGAAWFRQHVQESLAMAMVGEIGTAQAFTNAFRVGALLTTLTMGGTWCHFLPTAEEVTGQYQTYLMELVTTMQNMPGGIESAMEDEAALQVAYCAKLGSSEAEREALGMFVGGMALPYKRLFATEGGLFGVAPAAAQQGDEVWLIRGAKVPFILRRKEGGLESDFTLARGARLGVEGVGEVLSHVNGGKCRESRIWGDASVGAGFGLEVSEREGNRGRPCRGHRNPRGLASGNDGRCLFL
ncbi:heterokaryon incompatibility protein-domain-containing protein [Podospora conica]|nr:heterokaryon incompatibility protein-domain-containing protein [Schizothecium conicum]